MIAITTSSSIKVNRWFFIVPPLSIVALFLSAIYHLLNPMPPEVNLGVRSPKGRRSRLQLRFPIARDHALTHKFGLPFRIITVHKLVVMSYADGSGGPTALRTSPLASELPLTCEAVPFAGAASPLTCPPAAANSSTFAALTTPEGLRSLCSASSLSFLVILLLQNNSLTFVRGADRAYCALRKWSWRPTKARLYRQPRDPEGRRARTRRRHLAALSTFPASPATVVFCRRYRLSMYIIPENHRNAQTIKPSSLAQIRNPPGRYHASFPSKRISHSRRKREGVIPVFC